MKTLLRGGLILALLVSLLGTAHGDTAAEILEKGIYNEETIGNLDEAIKMYRQVLDVAGQTERIAAKAQFRLGQCLLKQAKKEEAIAAFRSLIQKYPDQKELVEKAKEHIPADLVLQSAPWKSGERLALTMKLPGGQTIGLVGLAIDAEKEKDKALWKMSVRRFVSSAQNEGVSHITVDRSTNRPLKTQWDHMLLGAVDGTWHDDKIDLKVKKPKKTEDKTIEYTGQVFSNDQVFWVLRQLPLAVGYKVTVPIRVAFTGGAPLGLEVEVTKKERIETPVGEFNCFRLETNIRQTFWIADAPERYLTRFDAEGVTATLTALSKEGRKTTLANKHMGLTVELPKGWFAYPVNTSNEDTSGGFRLVAPNMVSAKLRVRDKSLLDRDERESLDAWAEGRIRAGRRAFKDLRMRSDGVRDTEMAGSPAKSFVIDQVISGRDIVRASTLGFVGERAIDFSMSTTKAHYADAKAVFDQLQASIRVR